MDLRTYYYGLDIREREAFARRAQTTVGYIQCHLITRRKIPRPSSMHKLAAASENSISLDDLLAYFYKPTATPRNVNSELGGLEMTDGVWQTILTPNLCGILVARRQRASNDE